MKIGNVKLKSDFVLAPMAGFTDVAFRSICSSFGAGLTTTEMVSVKGLLYKNENTNSLLNYEANESPKAVQIFSKTPADIAKVVKSPYLLPFDIIDINMGCPMPKIVKEGMGSALLNEPKLAFDIISSAVKNSDKPITVKFRIGYTKNSIIATDFAKMCEDAGASAICVHGRTREQLYMGEANWDEIEKVVNSVKIPVIGNGDVQSIFEAKQKMQQTGCAGVAIGRAALGKPWIFSEKQILNQEIPNVIRTHYEILKKYEPEKLVVLHMRKHLASYVSDVFRAKQLRYKLSTSTDINEIFKIVDEVFLN